MKNTVKKKEVQLCITGAIERRGYDDTSRVVCYDVEYGDERTGSKRQIHNAGQSQRQEDETALFQADSRRDRRILKQDHSLFFYMLQFNSSA